MNKKQTQCREKCTISLSSLVHWTILYNIENTFSLKIISEYIHITDINLELGTSLCREYKNVGK